ncbi:ABC transporter substrate-binding protein [Vibrio tapetis subsp. quintayensis]|uniref:ABC transporter substrate-binding protein n=1 Tax=Vibrio tapetis TaxID=52443 RepID=UPI0025B3C52E|nr:ABC transporter substrate-binding protein [Vibrio tapetis]MDN3680853.1 ABC transporter substrate-binding protein [Vibrio tapetis subsp. quintayensis]
MKKLIGLILCCATAIAQAAPLVIPGKPGEVKLMQAVLAEIAERSDRFEGVSHYYGQNGDPNTAKMTADLMNGNLDIMYVAASKENESNMSTVYFPIYRGLLGMRLGIVTQPNVGLFQGVTNFSQVRNFVACQGKAWPDTAILEANGIKIAKSLKYPNLFPMLDGGRCDYFPRGVFEPFTEVVAQSQFNLAVDEYVMLRYRMPFYFYTAKNDPELAMHFQDILYDMFEDGTYERLFFADKEVSDALNLAGLEKRTIFDLNNPELSQKSQQIPNKFWFDPLKEVK